MRRTRARAASWRGSAPMCRSSSCRTPSLSRRLARALLRAVHAARFPHARHGVRADGRNGRQGLRRCRQLEERRALARRAARAGRFALRVHSRRARPRCAPAIVGSRVVARRRGGRATCRRGRRRAAAGDLFDDRQDGSSAARRATGDAALRHVEAGARGRRHREDRTRLEVRRHRAGAAWRRRCAGSRPTRCSRATCSTRRGRRIRSRSSRSSMPATRRSRKKTSAGAARRPSRSETSRSSARARLRRRARRPGAAARRPRSASCCGRNSSQALYADLELPLIPVLVDIERAGIRVDGPALAAQAVADRAGARRRAARRSSRWRARSSTSTRRSSCRRSCSTSSHAAETLEAQRQDEDGSPRHVEVLEELALDARACRGSSSNGARCRSSRAPTSMRCRSWSIPTPAACTPASIRPLPPPAA